MPWRHSHAQAPDSYQEETRPREETHLTSPSLPIPKTEAHYDLMVEETPSWVEFKNHTPLWKSNERNSVDIPEWEALSRAFTVDSNSNQSFPDDAPFELDESYSSAPTRSDLESAGSQSGEQTYIKPEDRTPRAYHGYSSLTMSEERELRDIAMPLYVLSDEIPDEMEELSDLPERATQMRQQKRKSSMSSDADDATHLQQVRKKGHNVIEKRYRTNLNDKIFALQQCIPTMRIPSQDGPDEMQGHAEQGPNVDRTQKYRKAAVLVAAVDYITELGSKVEKLDEETDALKVRLAAFEMLIKSGSMVLSDGSR